ncbi:MAG: hypothetical protein ACRD7E_32005 [Bryobacteraceae bacterium]
MSAEVEQLLIERLTRAYGTGQVPDNLYEIGASRPEPGLSWQAGEATIFLHRNRNYVAPIGVREGVSLIAVRREVLEERTLSRSLEEAFRFSTTLSHGVMAGDLVRDLGALYLPPEERPASEPERVEAERATRAALLRLLRQTDQRPTDQRQTDPGERGRRSAMLVAADDLTVRLGGLLIARTVRNGGEIIAEAPGSGRVRAQLASYGVRYSGVGHYSGELEYDRSLLRRAWNEFPDTPWGQRAFLMRQRLSCSIPDFGCQGPNRFRTVIEKGERFLREYPDTSLRKEQVYHLALANETWWSLSQAEPGDLSAQGAEVDKVSGERARKRAIELYEELQRIAPGSPEARAGQLALPRLKLGLGTGERTFFCFSC